MADFCKQCSVELFGEDYQDLKGLCPEGFTTFAMCEGCGYVAVNSEGDCVCIDCLKGHGLPKVGDTCCAAIHTDNEYFFGVITEIEGDLAWSNLGSKFLSEPFCGDLPTKKRFGAWLFDSF